MNPYLAWPRSAKVAAVLFMVIASGFLLIAAKDILIPIALAVLIAFSLHPLVKRLIRAGVNRIVAVVLVVGLSTFAVGGIGFVVSSQLKAFADELPAHEANIVAKVRSVKAMFKGGTLDRLTNLINRVNKRTAAPSHTSTPTEATTTPAVPVPTPATSPPEDPGDPAVATAALAESTTPAGEHSQAAEPHPPTAAEVSNEPTSIFGTSLMTNPIVSSVIEALATAGIVILLVTFFLIQQADIRDRIVSVAGRGALATTTKALEEAGARISRYLLMLFVVNSTYGFAVALGLWLMGVPYAIMWGLAAGVIRYVPYIGPWIGALAPISVSLVTSPGWTQPLMVLGLFVLLELFSNNIMEPILYGRGVGLSEIGVILSAVIWAWLWGPIGLVLATPMTVCLVVLGRYVPGLRIFDHLLGDQAAVSPFVRLYQRLLAKDAEDVEEMVKFYLKDHSRGETADDLIVPAMELIRQDLAHDQIDDGDSERMNAILRDVIEERMSSPPAAAEAAADEATPLVIGVAAHADEETILLELLNAACQEQSCRIEVLSSGLLQSERVARIVEQSPELVVVSSLPPGDLPHARQLCKRLKAAAATRRIVVARWGKAADGVDRTQSLQAAGADEVVTTISELEPIIKTAFHMRQASKATAPASSAISAGAKVQAG
ncbi:MAG TPA: AI-2E family transporter [Caulifigura sp.]|jgi:predicted PurR-regulated permease PerM/methylmalonyl-CoA mutase cobalamin-binding subunit|nr:AI-2E family transporter [Caulifigura sp.]